MSLNADSTDMDKRNTVHSPQNATATMETLEGKDANIKLISWNIDGERTLGVADKINSEKPDVVFLQEVVQESESILLDKCPAYKLYCGFDDGDDANGDDDDNDDEDDDDDNDDDEEGYGPGYYTAIMIKENQVTLEGDKTIIDFPTRMMRNLLMLKCNIKGVKFTFMTSHLESTMKHSKTRQMQLKIAFFIMSKCDADRTVVFGGDLNLRNFELQQIGDIPENMYDLWEMTGRRPEARITWDTIHNTNLGATFKAMTRYDRLYIRDSTPKRVTTEHFELTGLEKLKSCQRFCSDHWGLMAHFKVT